MMANHQCVPKWYLRVDEGDKTNGRVNEGTHAAVVFKCMGVDPGGIANRELKQ